MKTIPVSLILAGVLAPIAALAQPGPGPEAPPRGSGENRRGQHRPFAEAWKAADKDRDGSISKDEFGEMPRIQNLPAEKQEGLFKRLDKDGNGKLGQAELSRLGRPRDGQGPPMPRLWELDADKSGGVTFGEFKDGPLFKKLTPEKQQAVFRRLDTNGDGTITPKDRPEPPFRRDGGPPHMKRPDGAKPMEPRPMIRQLDKDADGALSFEEFRAGPAVKNLTEDEQEDRFEALDRNHDRKLSPDDFPPPPACGDAKGPESPPAG